MPGADVFTTPRPPPRAPTDTSLTSSISHGDNSTGSFPALISYSGSRTPIKQFQRMDVAARDPVRFRQLSVEDPELPETLRTIVRDLSLLGKRRGVIQQGLQASPSYPWSGHMVLTYFPLPSYPPGSPTNRPSSGRCR